ncbi:MAG: radical SAM protein [Candidatus Omnitrophota bacterium]
MKSKLPTWFLLKAFMRSPGLVLPLTKMSLRKHRGVDKDYKNSNAVVSVIPNQISIRITNACNHRCAVCGQYGKDGYMHKEKGKELTKTLPLEKYKELVDQMEKHKPIYYLTGGEPFLYPDFVELVNYMKQRGSIVSVVTNGVKLREYAQEIVKNSWDMILVSFDGPEQIHDTCRGLRGAYKTAVNGLMELKRQKAKQRNRKVHILTSLTLSPANVNYIEETFELNKKISPHLMVVYLSWFTSEHIGDARAKILGEQFGVEPFTCQSYTKTFSLEEAQAFSDNLEKVRNKKWPFDYLVVPDLKGSDVRDYYLYPEKTFGYDKCFAPFIMIDIMPNGDVTTCRDYIDIKVGSINEESLLDIWNSKKFVAFRRLLIKHNGILPQCSRCCGLMGF